MNRLPLRLIYRSRSSRIGLLIRCYLLSCFIGFTPAMWADERPVMGKGNAVYGQLKDFNVGYRSVRAENLVLKKDRVTLTFRDGMLYFPAPVEGKVRGAVFLGTGTFQAAAPPVDFEPKRDLVAVEADQLEITDGLARVISALRRGRQA